jgi:hypothetical protein
LDVDTKIDEGRDVGDPSEVKGTTIGEGTGMEQILPYSP